MSKYIKKVVDKEAIVEDLKQWFPSAYISSGGHVVKNHNKIISFRTDGEIDNTWVTPYKNTIFTREDVFENVGCFLKIEDLIIKERETKELKVVGDKYE